MTYSWLVSRLPSQEMAKGGFSREQFETELWAPEPERPNRARAQAQTDSGAESLMQFVGM